MKPFELLHVSHDRVRTDLKCTSCDLCKDPRLVTNRMPGEGPGDATLMFVGQAPGKEDDGLGKPFVSKPGELLNELLQSAGIPRKSIYVTNALKCHPYDTKIKDNMFAACKANLLREIMTVKPKALVAVGAQAFEWLTGQSGVVRFRKHVLDCAFYPGLPVLPIQQPSALFHARGSQRDTLRAEMIDDLLWLRNKAASGDYAKDDDIELDHKTIRTVEEMQACFDELNQVDELCCDLETTELFPTEGEVITCIGFSKGPGHARSIPLWGWGTITLHFWSDDVLLNNILPLVRRLLKTKKIFGHNFPQFDQKWLKFLMGIDRCDISFDTMLAHYLVDEEKGTHDLESLALQYTKMTPWKKDVKSLDINELCKYNCKDVDATSRVRLAIEAQLTERQKWLLHNLLIPLSHELMEMEYRGVRIDQGNLQKFRDYLKQKQVTTLAAVRSIPEVQAFEIDANTTININSSDHVGQVMEKYLKLPAVSKTRGGAYSTDRWTLDHYKNVPFVAQLTKCRGLTKLLGTYGDGMAARIYADGQIHTSYMIHGTVTGRLASQNPNLQNIPREDTAAKVIDDGKVVKSIFASTPGYYLLQADYSQAELRVLAAESGDRGLMQVFLDGLDAHTATAAAAYAIAIDQVTKAQRTNAKSINFGLVYGMSEQSLCEKFVTSGSTAREAMEFLAVHKRLYPKVWAWLAEQERLIKTQGYQETWFGRRRRYKGAIGQHEINAAYNFPIQSMANDITLFGIVNTAQALRAHNLRAAPILTVHDSIVFEVHEDDFWETAMVVKYVLENPRFEFLTVPMVVDLDAGLTWGHMKSVDVEKMTVG